MFNIPIKDILGSLLIITSIFDAVKYSIQAFKIQKVKSAKSISRKFINFAILNDVVKLCYGFAIMDLFIIVSSLLAIGCMMHLFYIIYQYYPYRMRGCINFKKPNILLYTINSILPNRLRKRL